MQTTNSNSFAPAAVRSTARPLGRTTTNCNSGPCLMSGSSSQYAALTQVDLFRSLAARSAKRKSAMASARCDCAVKKHMQSVWREQQSASSSSSSSWMTTLAEMADNDAASSAAVSGRSTLLSLSLDATFCASQARQQQQQDDQASSLIADDDAATPLVLSRPETNASVAIVAVEKPPSRSDSAGANIASSIREHANSNLSDFVSATLLPHFWLSNDPTVRCEILRQLLLNLENPQQQQEQTPISHSLNVAHGCAAFAESVDSCSCGARDHFRILCEDEGVLLHALVTRVCTLIDNENAPLATPTPLSPTADDAAVQVLEDKAIVSAIDISFF